MDDYKSKVYIQTDDKNRIIRCEGGYTTPADLTGWIYIDEGDGDKYNLCQSNYFDGGLYTYDGIPRYKWDGEQAVERTDAEIEADRAEIPEPPPTTEQRVSELEEQLMQADEVAISLYEVQAEQELINAQQDEALMEIYEMLG